MKNTKKFLRSKRHMDGLRPRRQAAAIMLSHHRSGKTAVMQAKLDEFRAENPDATILMPLPSYSSVDYGFGPNSAAARLMNGLNEVEQYLAAKQD